MNKMFLKELINRITKWLGEVRVNLLSTIFISVLCIFLSVYVQKVFFIYVFYLLLSSHNRFYHKQTQICSIRELKLCANGSMLVKKCKLRKGMQTY
jgi:hypothetical protein